MKLSYAILPLIACLAGCSANRTIDLEARTISIDQNAVPAAIDTSEISHLIPRLGPTYVTLNVKELSKGDRPSSMSSRAITSGSGYVVDPSGVVMTAAHVAVELGNEVSARAGDGRVYTGKVVSIQPTNDMAIIKLRGFSGPAATPALPGCVDPGELVFTLGRPHAQGDTARVGELKGRHFGRAVAYGDFGYTDALILQMGTQKGESGGPLFNREGQLIGMVVSTLTDSNGQLINQAHAIPSTMLAKFLCSKVSCTPQWSSVSVATVDSCGTASVQ